MSRTPGSSRCCSTQSVETSASGCAYPRCSIGVAIVMLSSSARATRGVWGGDDAGKTLVERRVVRTGALAALGLARRNGFVFAAAARAHHAGRRQQLLQVHAFARGAARRPIGRHEGFEVPAAAAARVLKQGHTESLLYIASASGATGALPYRGMALAK